MQLLLLAWESRPIRPARICVDRTGSLASMKHSINLTSARLPNGQLGSRAFHPICFTPVPACPRPPHRCPHEVSLRVRVPGVLLEMARPWGASQIYKATGVPEQDDSRSGMKGKSAHASHVPPRVSTCGQWSSVPGRACTGEPWQRRMNAMHLD